jgi:N-acetylneuraminic acid mutarotase
MNQCPAAHAQSNEWTWMSGSSTFTGRYGAEIGELGVYGILGQASPLNIPGGRLGAVSWTDASGNFWLFGGGGLDSTGNFGFLNDLWKYDPAAKEWTWISGSDTLPIYNGGQPGEYGMLGSPGPGNVPGGRAGALGWTDANGNLWLFGGAGFDSAGTNGDLNDLWEFNVSSREWAWMGGTSKLGAGGTVDGTYGVKGVFAAGNYPGSQNYGTSWTDHNGNFWLFGGYGTNSLGQSGILNELWEYVPSTGLWAWMSGGITSFTGDGESGIYGTLGQPAPENTPGARYTSASWVDANDNLWLFGGDGYAALSDGGFSDGFLNDLWKFDPASGEWTWMGGSNTFTNNCATPTGSSCSTAGMYGTLGVPSAANIPGGRSAPVVWVDQQGNFWLFGGEGDDSINTGVNLLNDVWEFNPIANEWAWMGGSSTIGSGYGRPGVYGTLGEAAAGNIPGGRDSGVSWVDLNGNLWLMSGNGLDSTSSVGYLNDLWQYQPAAIPAEPTFNPAAGTYTSTQSVSIGDAAAGATIYYTTDGTTPTTGSAVYSGAITVASTETIEAFASAGGFAQSAAASATYTITPPAATPTFSIPTGTYAAVQSVTISDATPDATIYYAIDGTPTTSSTVYGGAISVSSSETIEAIAVANGFSQSALGSAAYVVNLPVPGFTLSGVPPTMALATNAQSTFAVTVTPENGFNSAVSFACSGLPAGAICTFSPASVTPSGSAASTQLTITAGSQAAALHRDPRPFVPGTGLGLAACLLGWKRRRGLRLLLLAVVAAAAIGVLSGCNAALLDFSAPTTSQVTVTATSGSIQQSAAVALTVK